MSEPKKCKTRDEWKKLINIELTAEGFQDLCYDIICNNAFKNVAARGKGADGGRDLEAEFEYPLVKDTKTEKCWFQCKKQATGVNFGQISTEVQQAEDLEVKRFFVVSNSDMTPDCKDAVGRWNHQHKCEINDWTGNKFLDSLFGSPRICTAYFPNEEVPPLVDVKKPEQLIQQSTDLGKRFGIEFQFKTTKETNLNNPHQLVDILKEALTNLKNIDVNLKALIFQKMSMFFFSLERHDDALMLLERSLEITPKNPEALLNKGYILEKIDRVAESTRCYDDLLQLEPLNKFALNNKAHNLRRQGRLDEALKAIESALDVDSGFLIAIQTKVAILASLNKAKEALDYIDLNAAQVVNPFSLKRMKVSLYIELLDLKKAYLLNEELLTEAPTDIEAINSRGVIYEKNAQYQLQEKYLNLALKCFEEVVSKENSYPLGWSNKAVVFINAGQNEEAEKILDLAYTQFPKNPYVLDKKGVLLSRMDKPAEALRWVEKALAYTYDEDFWLDKVRCLLQLGHWNKARIESEKLLKNNPHCSEAWEMKARALEKLHETSKAKLCRKKAKEFKKKPLSLLEDEGTPPA